MEKTVPEGTCRFSLSPMSDDYIDIILGAVGRTDTGLVKRETGKLSTVYRGSMPRVEDAVRACFCFAYRDGVHMTMEATFRITGTREEPDSLPNCGKVGDIHFPVVSKYSFYPLGSPDREKHILRVANIAGDIGVFEESLPDCRVISGDVGDIFAFIARADRYRAENCPGRVLEVTFSVNSPTRD